MTIRVLNLLSPIFFSLFLLFVIIFIFLVIFDQQTTTTIIEPTQTPTPTPSFQPLPLAKINQLTTKSSFAQDDIKSAISPVVSTIETSGISPSNVSPGIPPNLLPPSFTFGKPLQFQPECFGSNSTMTFDAGELLGSMQNGEQSFSQFNVDSEQSPPKYVFAKDSYVTQQDGISNSNRIIQFIQGTSGNVQINPSASSLGCIGVRSTVLSLDDLRLYVGYIDSTINSSNPFAFQQTIGRVQVWSRQSGPDGTALNATDSWQHSTDLKSDLANPFGSQIVGIPVINSPLGYNAFTETVMTGDEFGSCMCTSYRVATNLGDSTSGASSNYAIAVGSQTGVSASIGRCINMFEEQPDLSYECTGILFLPTSGILSSTFTTNDRSSFGTTFTLVGDTCIASLGAHNTPGSCRLANFRFENHVWAFVDIILPPNANEFFGTSLAMAPYGGVLIVGSPASSQSGQTNIPPKGGHVYMYVRSSTGIWELNYSLIDPFLVGDFPNLFTFGWFVNVSRDFRFLIVSANQDSIYRPAYPLNRPIANTCLFTNNVPTRVCSYTCIEVFAIDQAKNVIDVTSVSRVYQDTGTDSFIDPLFGARVDVAVTSSGTLFLTGSPLNQTITLFQMGST